MSRLRVLHVGKFYPPHRGGMESHVATLCRQLQADAEVQVIVSADGKRTETDVVDGVPVTRIGTAFGVASASINPGMARAIRRAEVDVIHFHHPNPTAVLSYLASGNPAPLVVTYHSDIVRQRVLGAAFAPVLHLFLRRARVILASSAEYARTSPTLRRHAGRVRIVPFGIRVDEYAAPDPAEVAALRGRLGPRVVLGAGRLVYYKGFEYLVRAMASVPGQLVLVGDGPLREPLEALAGELGIAERVTFAGAVPDLAPWYAAADVFVLPAVERSEAFGLVQLEAMSAGLPVINTRIPSGVPFVSMDGESGLTVPPRDAPALADALARLLDDEPLRARLARGARARVAAEFSLERMAADTLAAYRAAIAAG